MDEKRRIGYNTEVNVGNVNKLLKMTFNLIFNFMRLVYFMEQYIKSSLNTMIIYKISPFVD